jgi:hypothetical protein
MTALTSKFESTLQFESKYPLLPQALNGGKVKCVKDTIKMDYDFQSGDVFTSDLIIPENAVVVDAAVLGPAKTTGIFSLGDGTTADAFVTDCNLDAALTRYQKMAAGNSALLERVLVDTPVVLTCSENATGAEGADTEISVAIYFILD